MTECPEKSSEMGRKDKPRIIPEQDRRICGSICLCQLTIVLSCVAIVYLSVAIYMPSYKAFQSGFEAEPVLCQTINTTMANNCGWASCGEWCLTKTSGFCPQIHATVRRNGTDVLFENCTRSIVTHCPQVSARDLKRYNCNNGSECASLTGVFNCSLGHCANFSELFECHYKADGIIVDAEKDNMKLNGFFYCRGSNCTQIKKSFPCDRYCSKITTSLMSVFVMHNNSVSTMDCDAAYALTESRGPELGVRLDTPVKVWDETMGYLMTNCMDIQRVSDGNFIAYDCLNGTVIQDPSVVPEPFTNFTTFWRIYDNSTVALDPTQRYLPNQSTLTIYNNTKLFINLEGCVNTLRGECKEFLFTHGQDGRKNTAQSRYQCFYNKHHENFVVARFDLSKTWRELLIAVIVPSTLFVISCLTLILCQRTVVVGDDAKMRCKYCMGNDSEIDDFGNVITTQPLSTPTAAANSASNHISGKKGKNKNKNKVGDLKGKSGKVGREVDTDTDGDAEEPAGEQNNELRNAMENCAVVIDEQEMRNLSLNVEETSCSNNHVLIALSPCTEVSTSQKEESNDEDGVAESCLSTSSPPVAVAVKGSNGNKPSSSDVDPDTPLMIL